MPGNKYQSLIDWMLGRYECPECGEMNLGYRSFSDCTLATIEEGEVVEKRLSCLYCDFEEVVWEKSDE